jgi:hypothetical protein
MIITGDTYVGRTAARSSSEWHSALGVASSERRRCQSYLACVLGNDSALNFDLVEADGQPGVAYDVIEVRQCLDLSAVALDAKVRICLRSGSFGSSLGVLGVLGYYPFGEYRFTIIRYGALRLRSHARLADLLALDCTQLFDARGVSIASDSLMLLNVRGHGTSGSIQLVSRSLGLRLLKSYPSIYSS